MKKVLFALLVATAPAAAQPANDVEVPTIVMEQNAEASQSSDEALDLANIVQSAAKGVTTVQEAPAIVTVVTSDEIRDRQFQNLTELVDTVPGWGRVGLAHSNFQIPMVRGQSFAVQFLQDGLSMFDPFVNVPSVGPEQPMELIKRVEMITGPGGVLWGSNSLMGILNVITKDAEDVEGVETGLQLGDGDGDRMYARAYAMGGKSDLAGGKAKLFLHGSVTTYQGAGFQNPLLEYHSALPQPNSQNVYGPLATSQQPQTLVVNLDGKLTIGKLVFRIAAPFGTMYTPMGLSGDPVRDVTNTYDPNNHARKNGFTNLDRYVSAEYRSRFAHDKAGITARVYAQQFVRTFNPLIILTPRAGVEGGAAFGADLTSYRAGAAFDADVEVSRKLRVLYGAEGFHEFMNGDTISDFVSPDNLALLPIRCPQEPDGMGSIVAIPGCPVTFAYAANRTVLGAYVDPQFRPSKKLILDAGVRLQVAPGALGNLSYPLTTTLGGTIVYNFLANYHLKLNYAQGFRPPVFNNTSSNGEGVEIGGNPNLKVETSDAAQAEINGRIYKGDRRIRELSFRIDGSYTLLQNLIQVQSGNYANTADKALYSVEFLGKLYVQGGHRIELGYTWLRGDSADKGRMRYIPEHWFNLGGVWALANKLTATTTLKVTASTEDANRLVEYRNATLNGSDIMNSVTVQATDLVMDLLPPVAELNLGVQYAPTQKLAFRVTVYNALLQHSYQPDVFADYEPHLEYLPNPFEGFRAYFSAMYSY
jgi:outer membrane receptor protein involved in Fe transport